MFSTKQLRPQDLQKVFQQKQYTWHPLLNIVGIRSSDPTTDVFNDAVALNWVLPAFPSAAGVLEKQKLCNLFGVLGKDGKPLDEDGKFGSNTLFAFNTYASLTGKWLQWVFPITTDPGRYYLQHPMNSGGCAVLKAGQHKNMWQSGYHQKNPKHHALVQSGAVVTVYLDNNRDTLINIGGDQKTGFFGINLHHASTDIVSQVVGKWSAGCQVMPDHEQHARLMAVCDYFKTSLKNLYTYTLLEEKDL